MQKMTVLDLLCLCQKFTDKATCRIAKSSSENNFQLCFSSHSFNPEPNKSLRATDRPASSLERRDTKISNFIYFVHVFCPQNKGMCLKVIEIHYCLCTFRCFTAHSVGCLGRQTPKVYIRFVPSSPEDVL